MLIQLNIKNFALIEDISVQFDKGFSILSGETGAGKSILIDAIDFVLGGKFSKDSIRTGEKSTFVEAVFSLENNNLEKILEELGIEFDNTLIISREAVISGKNIIKINGRSVIAASLKKIREKLLDIHGQHKNNTLLDRSSHIIYLDNFIGKNISDTLAIFSGLRQELKEVLSEISEVSESKDTAQLLEYTKFQIEDIEKANLRIGEEEELSEEYKILSNSEKITEALSVSYRLLSSNEDGESVIDSLSKVINNLSSIEDSLCSIKSKKDTLQESFYNIQDISAELRDLSESITFDKDKLEKINQRLYQINNYKNKYGKTISEVLDYYKSLKEKYDNLLNSDKILEKLKNKQNQILSKMNPVAEKLHKIRQKYAKELEDKILNELSYVGLEKSRMEIEVNKADEFNENGFDNVRIMISTNPGEPLKSLEKVLSGGELSRIMLALKCVYADKDQIESLIFDEIDTGISGVTGQRVGEKMYQLSIGHQILCITHLPQIAAFSDNHYYVTKQVKDNKTYTSIRLLSNEDKIRQIASMIGGESITQTTLDNAKEMVSFADEKKLNISQYS